MTSSTIERIRASNPVTDVDAARHLTPEQWDAMFKAITAGSTEVIHESARRVRLAFAVAACALALAVAVPVIAPDAPGAASPAAADALHRAADAARAQEALPAPGPGEYLYRKFQEHATYTYVAGHGLDNFMFTETSEVQDWDGTDASGRRVTSATRITFPTSADEAAWHSAGEPRLETARRDRYDQPGERFVVDVDEVPTDPDELLAAIERREILGGDEADWVTVQIIGELLNLTYYSPEHRAALYEVAANFPGVYYQGQVTDPLGRTGDTISYDAPTHRYEFIFDPDTAELLAERQVMIEQEEGLITEDTWPGTIMGHAGPPGTVASWRVYEQAAVVDSTHATP
jgi:hypothetical protein